METLPDGVAESLEFEKRNWAKGSVLDDPFYEAPHEASESPLGTLLKIEKNVDTTKYLLPPTTAFSRFIYQSETLNGSKVPVSAYVLWPYSPRSQPDGYPVVAWAHGTSGFDANAGPSHHKNLWQHFLAPYQIALYGYVVVATDYAGLGVGKHSSGEPIVHEYMASPSQANDVIHSVRAAQAAFPELSKRFVVIGHSQGGGAAWSVAQRVAIQDVSGYLGAIAVSPYTSVLEEPNEFATILAAAMCPGLASAVPEFRPGDLLTAEGEKRLEMVHRTGAAISSAVALLSGVDILKPNWRDNNHFREYLQRTCNGGKAVKGPLLITHGKSDPVLSPTVVENAVKKTAERFPSAIQYVSLPNVTHVSALAASQHVWMDWIADRFAGREVESTCRWDELACARPHNAQQIDQNWYLESATKPYHAPGP
ncbi:hypothetical protein ABVK25_006077 [Lepraria finkii]|uniref:Serine aminopeptidase S33 domain-containing protein n=1 Tax=Lepraria finkii TaxID=1340010 RepID=A0ABR4B7D2_9LECA